MNWSWSNRIFRCAGSLGLLVLTAVASGSFLACLSSGQLRMLPAAALFLGLFVVFDLWWMLLGFTIWLTWFPPRSAVFWSLLILTAGLSGLAASWRFQTVRPWDFYHEADGSRPGWEPVRMASPTTVISCLSAVAGVVFSSLAARGLPMGSRRWSSKTT